ncbi:MAG: nicotinate-nucleotide diphosphorylase (carboxylating), partial [Planctomycetota bacterium]
MAKAEGIVAGVVVARWVFETVESRIRCTVKRRDGQTVRRGQVIIDLHGPARGILTAERTALNFLGHLSGIATLAHQFVQRARTLRVAILDTRKTLPGFRALEKYAVRAGGGHNHRWGLDDAVLIKTNHLRAISRQQTADSNTIQDAIQNAKRHARGKFIEIEVTNLREFLAALQARPDAILL